MLLPGIGRSVAVFVYAVSLGSLVLVTQLFLQETAPGGVATSRFPSRRSRWRSGSAPLDVGDCLAALGPVIAGAVLLWMPKITRPAAAATRS